MHTGTNAIMLVVTTCSVPFNQVVREVRFFANDAECLSYINSAALQWWTSHGGDGYVGAELGNDRVQEPFEPIKELGYDMAKWNIMGEWFFECLLDEATEARLHEAHYKRNYDDLGHPRPGYLINAYAAGS